MTQSRTLVGLAAAALFAATVPACAHGNEDQAKHHNDDVSKVEQTVFGREGDPKKVVRTIKVDMADTMRFKPAEVRVRRGQTVRFVLHNGGKRPHEMVLGTAETLGRHAVVMEKFPEMEHADPNMAHVKPGATGQMVWQFTEAGEFRFACLRPGHFEAGMVGRVIVQ